MRLAEAEESNDILYGQASAFCLRIGHTIDSVQPQSTACCPERIASFQSLKNSFIASKHSFGALS